MREYINSNLNSLTKFASSSRTIEFKDPPMEHLLNDHGDRSNQHENSDRLCDETGHPIENMLEISMETESTT